MKGAGFRSPAVLALAIAVVTGLMAWPPRTADAQPPGRDPRCPHLEPQERALCVAFLAHDCDVNDETHVCRLLREIELRLTGSPFFPFEFTPTPTSTSTPTRTPTASTTPSSTETSTPTSTPLLPGAGALPGSILVYPRILSDGIRDTAVQIANVSNISVFAHCFYLNGAPLDPTMPPSASNPRLWLAVDFFVELTPQQPVFWLVSTGRMMPPGGGDVPPAVQPFTGELRCFQSDASLAPIGGNALTGNATLLGPGPEVAEYDAIALRALNVNSGTTLNLDGVEYEACPETLHAVHRADGPSIVGAQGIITSRNLLTVIPCTVDYNSEIPIRSLFSAMQHDEFELAVSTIQVLDYWNEYDLGAIFPSGLTGGFRYTSTVSPTMTCIDGLTDTGQTCSSDAQCPSGVCRAVPVLAILEKQTTRPGVPTTLSDEDVQGAGSLPTAFIQMPVGP